MSMSVPISIVITTRNRREDVLVAIESCISQEYPDFEVLVYDEASTDGTAEAIRAGFPDVRLFACTERGGYLVRRNQGFREAVGDYVVSLDDDAYFTDVRSLSRLAEVVSEYPQAGAVALPFTEPRKPPESQHSSLVPVGTQLRSYTGCAHAIRRDLANKFGGYPEFLIHQGEERHLCLRMLEAGYPTLMADTPLIVHLYSPQREQDRVDYYGYRNTLLFTGLMAPAVYVLPRLLLDSVQLMKHRFSWRTVPRRLYAIVCGWAAIWKYRHERKPVSRETYAKFRSLPGHGPVAHDAELPPVRRSVTECTKS